MSATYRLELHLTCDNGDCKEYHGGEIEYPEVILDGPKGTRQSALLERARKLGWLVKGNQAFCPHCAWINRFAERFQRLTAVDRAKALEVAHTFSGWPDIDPEQSAEDEVTYWAEG